MTRDDLLELADRVEQLDGPDRKIDLMIVEAIKGGFRHPWFVAPPSFTASLDSAMTLKPEELRLMLSEWDDERHLRSKGAWQAVLSNPGCDASFDAMKGFRCEHAATPALALTAASLRAIAERVG